MRTDLICLIGLAVLHLLDLTVKRITRRHPAASRRITPVQAVMLVIGSILLLVLTVSMLREFADSVLTPL